MIKQTKILLTMGIVGTWLICLMALYQLDVAIDEIETLTANLDNLPECEERQ